MFGMNDMMADILKKSIPPEVLALMTKENIDKLGKQAGDFVNNINAKLDEIVLQGHTNYERQSRILEGIAEIKEQLNDLRERDNAGGSRSSRGRGRNTGGSGNTTGDTSIAGTDAG